MSNNYYRGEMAPLAGKIDGNENQGNFNKYDIKIEFSGDGEFYCRVSIRGKDYFFRALTIPALRNQIRQTFPDVRLSFQLSRSAELATNPAAAAMLGRDR